MPVKALVITGPTASGKTSVSIELAHKFGAEVISADSMQIYKYMDIGTAKPTAEEMEGIPHHMLDVVFPWEEYSVAQYAEDARRCIRETARRGMGDLAGRSDRVAEKAFASRQQRAVDDGFVAFEEHSIRIFHKFYSLSIWTTVMAPGSGQVRKQPPQPMHS